MEKSITFWQSFFVLVKLGPWCERYTKLDPKKRLYHNLKGYSTSGKPIEDLHPDDVKELEAGKDLYIKDLSKK
jgi:hypothetical protein